MKITPQSAADIKAIFREVKADLPGQSKEKYIMMTCKLYNESLKKDIGTDDVERALKYVDADTKKAIEREIEDNWERLCTPAKPKS